VLDPLIYLLDILVFMGIFAMLALSLNLEYGFTGLGNFGKVAFFMIGAYTYALLSNNGVPFYLCLIFSSVIAGLIGMAISLPALRLKEDYLAITTLSFGEILRLILKAEKGIAGGVWGITVPPAFPWTGSSFRAILAANVGLVFICLGLCFIMLQLIANSPYGRVLRGIREDDLAAEALGKSQLLYKAQVFMLGSGIAGVAGGLFAQYIRFIDPYMFFPTVTFSVWIMIILGGPANNWGAFLGSILVEFLNRATRIAKDYLVSPIDPNNLQYILYGLLIIVILIYRPQGLLKEAPLHTKAVKRAKEWLYSR
jgi:branched-chain amino acid transport system permease protein